MRKSCSDIGDLVFTQLPTRHQAVEKPLRALVCPPFWEARAPSSGVLSLILDTDRFGGDFFNWLTTCRQPGE